MASADDSASRRAARRSPLAVLRSLPRGVMARGAVLIAIVAGGLLLLRWPPVAEQLTQENVTAVLGELRGAWYSPLLLVLAYALASPLGLPVSPLMIGGGAVFGAVAGSLYNLAGLALGAAGSFALAHKLGRDAVLHFTGPRLRRAERVFQRRGFWPLVQARFLPLPFAMINYGAALAGVRPGRFFAASLVGLLPATVMHTYFAARLARAAPGERAPIAAVWGTVWVLMALATGIPTLRDALRRRRRYRDLRAHRARRNKH